MSPQPEPPGKAARFARVMRPGALGATVMPYCLDVIVTHAGGAKSTHKVCPTSGNCNDLIGLQVMLAELGYWPFGVPVPTGVWDANTEQAIMNAAVYLKFAYAGGPPSADVCKAVMAAWWKMKHPGPEFVVSPVAATLPAAALPKLATTGERTGPTTSATKAVAVTPYTVTAPSPPAEATPLPMLPLCPEGQAFNISTGQCVPTQEPVGPVVCPEGMMPSGEDPYTCRPVADVANAAQCAAAGGAWDWGTATCIVAAEEGAEAEGFPWLYVGLAVGGVAVLGGAFWLATRKQKSTPNPRPRSGRRRRNR
jgi:hypothetical protein